MTTTDTVPTVSNVKRHAGVAGQYAYSATVAYPDEAPETITFTSSVYGPPIVMVTPSGTQTFVSEGVLDRIGRTLDKKWIRAFFGAPQ